MKSHGYLEYDPRHAKTEFEKWWLLLKCDHGLVDYYRHLIERSAVYSIPSNFWAEENKIQLDTQNIWEIKQVGFKINKSAWGPHISIIRGEKPKNIDLWRKYSGKKIFFEYNPEFINTNGKHWWIRIDSKELEDIRVELGLTPQHMFTDYKDGQYKVSPMHLTIGFKGIR